MSGRAKAARNAAAMILLFLGAAGLDGGAHLSIPVLCLVFALVIWVFPWPPDN